MNDYFCLEDFKKYSHILPNYFSDEYSKKTNELDEKYIELLENKKNKTLYDKILYRDLTHNYNFKAHIVILLIKNFYSGDFNHFIFHLFMFY